MCLDEVLQVSAPERRSGMKFTSLKSEKKSPGGEELARSEFAKTSSPLLISGEGQRFKSILLD